MSRLPELLQLLNAELERESRNPYVGQYFGLGASPLALQLRDPLAHMEWKHLLGLGAPDTRGREVQHGGASPAVGTEGFQVNMDVSQFMPSELSVKVVDGSIVIEGKHEEREDNCGFISRHFVRRYKLPKGYDPEKVASSLSSDGVLTVRVPKPQLMDKGNERVVQIQQTGPAHLNVKQNQQDVTEQDVANGQKGDGEKQA